jgi:hypothetical protein
VPKITCVPDGIYIHQGFNEIAGRGMKLFINTRDWLEDMDFAIASLEQSDDNVIHALESK